MAKTGANKAGDENSKTRGGFCRCGLLGWSAVLLGLAAVVLHPRLNIYPILLLDLYTPYDVFNSKAYTDYHAWLVDGLPVRDEIPLPEVDFTKADRETIVKMTKSYTFPVVIRNALKDSEAVKQWGNKEFWNTYADVHVLCGLLEELRPNCTVGDFFREIEDRNGRPFYISGASEIFQLHPELKDMVHSETIEEIAPGPRLFTQIFMGFPKMGSDIHSAIGVNIFRQVAGRKKWWFIPPSQIAYLHASINANGFSAHTHTMVGKFDTDPSPWMNKLERYTAILEPGDILINPPFFWHGILNLGNDPDELVIGVPTRYSGPRGAIAALRSDPVLTVVAAATMLLRGDFLAKFRNPGTAFQDAIAGNRAARGVGTGTN